ncbi:YrhB domain-containing protein [Streptomyces sp. CNQ085]|uniref:YrhB domain-containing protein n=1 Tax=Streptomyces sp. CNQ085 TaxID=2886944 RepID=UPI001F50B794|nr:YrhB domain-containing protein [Streptomyces sp. CNQ085]MCI0386724.1 YrhB family protein [Streptomyces sp. CNQ085]
MLSRDEAIDSARRFLGAAFPEGEFTIVVRSELTREHPVAWVVRFDSQEHIDTGNVALAPFVRVVVVPKDDSGPHFPPTHQPLGEYLGELARDACTTGA